MPKIKICGIREPQHAIYASKLHVDYLGFVFVENVRRQLTQNSGYELLQKYRQGITSHSPKLVGLFANQSLKFVNNTVQKCKLDMVQLCGEETSDYWKLVDVPVIKQIRVQQEQNKEIAKTNIVENISQILDRKCIPILDHQEKGQLGGTGNAFDWSIIEGLSLKYNFILAGGLKSNNVNLAIEKVKPWGLDVSSGVESNGIKDEKKILEFVNKIHGE
ncbi:MAG: phosphoribosylanthranilate isomerase [SAR202 cluster bacterium]|nr:phosphoribosylanthranilate isomerase [SAR202 cluster bacterium]